MIPQFPRTMTKTPTTKMTQVKKKSCIRKKSREIVTCHFMEIACGDLTSFSCGWLLNGDEKIAKAIVLLLT